MNWSESGLIWKQELTLPFIEIKATVDAVGKMISELDQNRKLFGSVLGAPVEKEIVETNEVRFPVFPSCVWKLTSIFALFS